MNPDSSRCLTPKEIKDLLYATLASPEDEFPSHPHLVSCTRCQEEFRSQRQSAELAEAGRRPGLGESSEDLRRMPMYVLAEQLRELLRGSRCPVRLRVVVATAPGPRQPFIPVLECQNTAEEVGQVVEVATGQLIRYEVTADREGYLTVLNFGAEGKVEVFLAQDPDKGQKLEPGKPAAFTTARASPLGKEHMAVLWTRQPNRLSGEEWQQRITAAGQRGQVLVLAEGDGAEDWAAVVVPVVQRAEKS